MTWHPVPICSSASSSVLNVKIYDGSKLAYVFTRSLLQAFYFLSLLFCYFLVTSWFHSRALSNLHTLANTVCLLYLHAIFIKGEIIVSSNTWNAIISNSNWHSGSINFTNCHPGACNTGGDSSPRCLPSPCHCFLIRNFSDVTCMAEFAVSKILPCLRIRKIITYNFYTRSLTCRVNSWQ